MIITVTGSKGFIGRHLVKRLSEKGHRIIAWDTSLNKNIKDFQLESTPHFVVHLAALANVRQSIENPQEYWKVNVEYSKRIFDACKGIPMVYASSSCVKEWWRSPYGTTKRAMEDHAHEGHVGLRFTTVWGHGARETMLMSRIKNGTLKYKTNHIRDFIHVSDVLSAIEIFIEQGTEGKNKVYDVGTGYGVCVADVVEAYSIDVPLKDGEDMEMESNVADTTEMEKLGWLSQTPVM